MCPMCNTGLIQQEIYVNIYMQDNLETGKIWDANKYSVERRNSRKYMLGNTKQEHRSLKSVGRTHQQEIYAKQKNVCWGKQNKEHRNLTNVPTENYQNRKSRSLHVPGWTP